MLSSGNEKPQLRAYSAEIRIAEIILSKEGVTHYYVQYSSVELFETDL